MATAIQIPVEDITRQYQRIKDEIADVIASVLPTGKYVLGPELAAFEEEFAAYCQAIAECCDYAADQGVGITIKPHGGLNATGPQCRQIVERVNHPNFRIWYDAGNILYYSNGQLDPVVAVGSVVRRRRTRNSQILLHKGTEASLDQQTRQP